jgi:Zn-dependent protease
MSTFGPSSSSYTYSWAPPQVERGRFTTSPRELLNIGVAFIVLTFDFILIIGLGGLVSGAGLGSLGSIPLEIVLACAGIAGTAFVCHEMAHKVAAERQGYWAEFRWSPMGLVFSIFTAFFGFLFALPGATVVNGMADVRQWGRTAVAGPASNLVFAGIFYAATVATWYAGSSVWFWLLLLAYFNAYFAAFNLIPFGPLDGAKVMRWSSGVWAVAFSIAAVGAAVCAISIYLIGRPLV